MKVLPRTPAVGVSWPGEILPKSTGEVLPPALFDDLSDRLQTVGILGGGDLAGVSALGRVFDRAGQRSRKDGGGGVGAVAGDAPALEALGARRGMGWTPRNWGKDRVVTQEHLYRVGALLKGNFRREVPLSARILHVRLRMEEFPQFIRSDFVLTVRGTRSRVRALLDWIEERWGVLPE